MRMADRHLVDKCLNGDPAAFGMLVDKYKESVYALAYSKLHNFHDAEDITQEAFIKAYQKLRTLRRWNDFHVWIYAITSNLCKNWIRAESRRPDREFIEDHPPGSLNRYSSDSRQEHPMLEMLHEALNSLPETYQQVLTLYYLGGMDSIEIAEFLGISPSAVWKRLSRARSSLKKEMLDMMSDTFEQQRLKAGFTIRIVETVKWLKFHPVSPKALPWAFSLATGIIIAFLGLGAHLNITNIADYASISSSTGRSTILRIGEFPIDAVKVSDISVTSGQQLDGSDPGAAIPNLQNALFMAPQAEGDTWTRKADMPTRREGLGCSTVKGKIYAIGGVGFVGPTALVEEYDPLTDKWVRKSNMPTARCYLSTSVVNDKIYAIGGMIFAGTDVALPTVEEYDPATDKWTKKTDMPTERQNLSTSAVNGKIYAIGGLKWEEKKSVYLPTVEEYDPATDEWTKKADMPAARYALSTTVANGKIYSIGGWQKGGDPSTLEEYDPVADKWTKKADMPTVRSWLATSMVEGRIYAIGGMRSWPTALSTVEEYDPATDKWTKKADMPTPRVYLSASEVNGKIYVIGGLDSEKNVPLSIVEEYEPGTTGENINLDGKLPTTWGYVRTALNK